MNSCTNNEPYDENAKKDLCLAYSQGNNTAYLSNIKSMARYLSTQYSNNKPTNQRRGKKGDKRKGDDSKSEDKDSNTGGTAGAHVEDTTTLEESTPPSGAHSTGACVSKTNVQSSRSLRTMEEIMGAHPMNDDTFWGNTNPTNVSIDITNSEEMMAGSHITELHTYKYKEPVPPELLNKVSNVPEVCDAVQKYQLDPSDRSKDSNMLSKRNNLTHTNGIDLSSQENQDYDNQHDQQLMTRKHDGGQGHHNQSNPQSIAYKHNGGVEQVNTEF